MTLLTELNFVLLAPPQIFRAHGGGKIPTAARRAACEERNLVANFLGWEKDHVMFARELEKVIRALRTYEVGRERRRHRSYEEPICRFSAHGVCVTSFHAA